MSRFVWGYLILLLAMPALMAEDKPKDKPGTPAQQYQALLREYQQAQEAYQEALKDFKTPQERTKLVAEKLPTNQVAPKLVELAAENPKDPIALDALIWVLSHPEGKKETRVKAVDTLVKDHIQSEKLGPVCQSLAFGRDEQTEGFLWAVAEKNPNKEIQAEACLSLMQVLEVRMLCFKAIKDNPAMARQLEESVGKELVDDWSKLELARVEADSEKFCKEFAEKHAAQVKPERVIQLCQRCVSFGGKGSAALLRTLLEKDTRRDVQGVACLNLAQVLKKHADELPEDEAKEAAKLRDEYEKLLETAANKYADVTLPGRGTVGSKAKSELFDLHHLSVGNQAPDVEGQDQNGKKFKLADYQGKVVLLDFWSQY